MNFLKRGPDLKLSNIRMPDFLVDIYWDLKDRHLLPLVGVLLVAIVAAPILLSQSGGSEESAPASPPTAGASSVLGTSDGNAQVVANSAPGLRNYRQRLRHLRAKNPFRQQYAGEPLDWGNTEVAGSPAEATESVAPEYSPETEPTPASPPTSAPAPTENPGSSPSANIGEPKLTYYSYAIDVRVTAGGSQDGAETSGAKGKPEVRHNLPELTMLPSRETPAAMYMGSTKDGKKALLLVSSDVTSIFGDAKCVLGSRACELIALEPGLPETFVYGGAGKTYKLELLKIHLVESKKLNRAPLGKTNGKKQQTAAGLAANSRLQPK